jgi:hypothetical protein
MKTIVMLMIAFAANLSWGYALPMNVACVSADKKYSFEAEMNAYTGDVYEKTLKIKRDQKEQTFSLAQTWSDLTKQFSLKVYFSEMINGTYQGAIVKTYAILDKSGVFKGDLNIFESLYQGGMQKQISTTPIECRLFP